MIRYANIEDLEIIHKHDKHITREELVNSIKYHRILVMYEKDIFIGWLRYNLFWDNTPFMNMLYFLDEYRRKGYGTKLISFWEQEMKKKGYDFVLTSTQSNEEGKFFYRKMGYQDIGSFTLPTEPSEIVLYKKL